MYSPPSQMLLAIGVSLVCIMNIDSERMLTLLAKAFPPAKVIFTGIGVLLGVRDLALPFVNCRRLTLKFSRRRRMLERATVPLSTSSSVSRAFSSA
jgi:hypothetical protein